MKPGSQYEFLDERRARDSVYLLPFFCDIYLWRSRDEEAEVGSWKGWKRSVKKLKL